MNVLIVSKTHIGQDYCVGGLSVAGHSLRLLTQQGRYQPGNTPMMVGQIWDLDLGSPPTPSRAPHTEDSHVLRAVYVGMQPNLAAYLRACIGSHAWIGGPRAMFGGGILNFTGNGSGYVSANAVPQYSTGFWLPDADLTFENSYYWYRNGWPELRLKYVGTDQPIQVIPANTLVRVSLARWWCPPDQPDMEERCYLQLSGWYL